MARAAKHAWLINGKINHDMAGELIAGGEVQDT